MNESGVQVNPSFAIKIKKSRMEDVGRTESMVRKLINNCEEAEQKANQVNQVVGETIRIVKSTEDGYRLLANKIEQLV